MRKFTLLLLFTILLTGCAGQTDPVETVADSAHQTIASIRESLPAECKTKAIEQQLNTADSTVDAVVSTCDMQKEALTQEKIRWQWSFIGLLIVVCAYIIKRLSARW